MAVKNKVEIIPNKSTQPDVYRQIVPLSNKFLKEPQNVTERVISSLVQFIRNENLQAGDKLPTEVKLCEILQVSSRSLREALVALKTIGVLQSRHGTGWYVEKFNPKNSLRFLSPLLGAFSGIDNIEEIMEVRISHEPLVAYKAAKNITQEGLEDLEQSTQILRANIGNKYKKPFRDADRTFHEILARESGSEVLSVISAIMAGLLFGSVMWVHTASNDEAIVVRHQEVVDSLAIRDGEKAAYAIKQHLIEGWNFLHEYNIIDKEYKEKGI